MATISPKKNKQGVVTGYKIRSCVGRDEQYKQVWRTTTISRPDGLTPARERKEIERLADSWEQAQKAEYEKTHAKETAGDPADPVSAARRRPGGRARGGDPAGGLGGKRPDAPDGIPHRRGRLHAAGSRRRMHDDRRRPL